MSFYKVLGGIAGFFWLVALMILLPPEFDEIPGAQIAFSLIGWGLIGFGVAFGRGDK